ncbi:MAG: CPBP family intramembrane metalloprotease [Bacteroidales bacterium]|nr:CPBP family intramembrane metalloprotease [Bacteroidales bacterium]
MSKKFFKRHQGRGSYDLFSNYAYYLPGVKGMLMMLLLFLVGSVLGSIISGVFVALMSLAGSQNAMTYSMLIAYPVSFIPPLLYASVQSRRNEVFDTGYALDSSNFGIRGGFSMAVIVSIATISAAFVSEPVGMLLPEMPEVLEKSLEMLTKGPLWVSLLSVSIFAPLFEEWLCRGIVLRGLLNNMKPSAAICLSAVFFAVLHMNPWQAIPAFLLGLLFGYVYYRTGSLKLTMLMHCVNNTVAVVTSRLPGLEDAETFMDILSPWAYICIFISCVLMLFSAIVILKGITVKDDKMGGCDKIDPLTID